MGMHVPGVHWLSCGVFCHCKRQWLNLRYLVVLRSYNTQMIYCTLQTMKKPENKHCSSWNIWLIVVSMFCFLSSSGVNSQFSDEHHLQSTQKDMLGTHELLQTVDPWLFQSDKILRELCGKTHPEKLTWTLPDTLKQHFISSFRTATHCHFIFMPLKVAPQNLGSWPRCMVRISILLPTS